ncbi:MAG: hypothetical protein KAJ45_05055, partial [Desulfobulbaceae bacterium]|nr:hypothetical protein [Desulfobulbaceae bacterium]
ASLTISSSRSTGLASSVNSRLLPTSTGSNAICFGWVLSSCPRLVVILSSTLEKGNSWTL